MGEHVARIIAFHRRSAIRRGEKGFCRLNTGAEILLFAVTHAKASIFIAEAPLTRP